VLNPDTLDATYGARVRVVRDGEGVLVTGQRSTSA
jgi:hypothetical protein